jgi:hypothetical protein
MDDFNADDINAVLNAVNDGDISSGSEEDAPRSTRRRRRNIEDSVADSDLNVFANADRKIAPGDMSDNDADTEEEPADNNRMRRGGLYRKRRSKYQRSPNSVSSSGNSRGDYDSDGPDGSSNASSPAGYDDMPTNMQMNEMPSPKRLSHSARLRLKAQLLARLERKQRFSGQAFEIPKDATLKELQMLDYKISYESRAAAAVKNYQRILIFAVGLWEGTCARYPWIGLDLTDYSEQVYLTIDQFDEDLYELYDMYGAQRAGHPLTRILMTIVTGSVAYSMTRKMMMARNNPQYGQQQAPQQTQPNVPQNAQQAQQQATQAKPTMATSVDDLLNRGDNIYGSGPALYNTNAQTGRYGQPAQMDLPAIPEEEMNDSDDEFGEMVGPPQNMIQQLRAEEDRHQSNQGKRMPIDAAVSELVQTETVEVQDNRRDDRGEPRTVPQSTRQRKKRGTAGVVPEKVDKVVSFDNM